MVLRIILVFISAVQCQISFSQSAKLKAAIGSDLYADSLYEESIDFYNESLKIAPNNDFTFNLANSYLQSGDLENAKKAYSQLLNSSSASDDFKAKAAYNLGNINYAEKDFPNAINNFKHSLELNSDDVDASENLQIALAQQQQQQQQQQKQEQQQQQQQQQGQKEENPEDSTPSEENSGTDKNPSENSNNEKEKKQSKSERVDIDKAEEFMKYLDKKENKTRERLDSNKKKNQGGENSNPEKDW